MMHIVIIYHQFEAEISEIFSSIFRLCGIYVLEYVLEQVQKWDTNFRNKRIKKTDLVLAVNWSTVNKTDSTLLKLSDRIFYIDYEKTDLSGKKNQLLHVFDDIKKKDVQFREQWNPRMTKTIIDQYIDKKLMHENYQIRLLFDVNNAESISERMRENFSSAAKNVENDLPDYRNYRQAFYFVNECKRKANIACRIGNKSRMYESFNLLIEIWRILDKHPDYTELYALCAMILDEDINFTDRSKGYYEKSLGKNRQGDERIQGYNHYRLGRYYEKVENNEKSAFDEYLSAYVSDPTNYRFTYKVAFFYEAKGDWKHAEQYYREILYEMLPYRRENYLQPSQCEYLFKVYFRLMLMYKEKMGQLRLARVMGDNAIELNEGISKNTFFERFYDEDEVEKLKNAMRERLKTEMIKEHLEDIDKQLQRFLFWEG